ncbi:MAG: methylmalonyl Co-A mutase-associated GTPase MeaB [Planctomycetes bacterium]|nr:methylmalonyl Co-A mutase-associated GTPase MeaB [Planctomycetota bacterium]
MTDATRASLADRLLAGERGALARMISWAENAHAGFPAALEAFWSRVGRAPRLGITGPPGAGKSTLVDELARAVRAQERTVGVLAVDPSSPLTGGALLGDRIRMEDHTTDPGVFIRSMASRGSHGGMARAAVDAMDVMDAYGLDEVFVETVGVGQAEYDVVAAADTVLVVLCPGAGDGVQALKSGLLEVADVIAINKADLPGADRLATDMEESVHIRTAGREVWTPPVVTCSAGRRDGVERVLEAIASHRAHLEDHLVEHRRAKRVQQVRQVVGQRLDHALWVTGACAPRVEAHLREGVTPYAAAARLFEDLTRSLGDLVQEPSA